MPVLRVVVLWHQHQPYYKDLVSGQYRLPWVRLHALKDYYGMVKLLDEFPDVHQTFNLVPSLITQIQDYVTGAARDPFLDVAAKPAQDMNPDERRFALQYLFQANPANLIGRYPRYRELWDRFRNAGANPEAAERQFSPQDFTDLQVLSQIAWFDEFFLDDPEVVGLIRKGHDYSLEDQCFVMARERELLAQVLPVHATAAQRGRIEISTSAFYHPILPLVCDTNVGAASSPGLPLPQNRFCHPEDAREQLLRGLNLHQEVFGVRPQGVWPSEGSVSEEVLALAQSLGVKWMATDEEVLGRSLGISFGRDGQGHLSAELAGKLYTIHRFESPQAAMNLIFRDHAISDLIGFVYSGMAPQDAANHLMHNIKQSAKPVLDAGNDAVVPIILDGENAWEYYPRSGREFLRRFYETLQREPGVEATTVSEAIQRHRNFSPLKSLVPGSWIHANFNVWIGAPEDNLAWDYLYHARDFYTQAASGASQAQRQLAFEEILIAEGSDWNWWYGPEHHSANDREFDELYRKHLSNIYQLLGGRPPDYLSQPITGAGERPAVVHQTAYIHPRIAGDMVSYFEWMGAAMHTADRRAGAMHGKQFLLDAVHAGIDDTYIYGRLDFVDHKIPFEDFELVVNLESSAEGVPPSRALRLDVAVAAGKIREWKVCIPDAEPLATSSRPSSQVALILLRNFEFKLPRAWLQASSGNAETRLRLRFSLWQKGLPSDALPVEGWMELRFLSEEDLISL
jgi:alpha-amylase/alpha-mannosidase (GH57 family)